MRAEIAIVGGGPAGSALAAALAERGRDVLLVDRHSFPRPKPCGECVNPGGVRALERLGLADVVIETGPVPLAGWSLVTPGGRRAWAAFPEGERAWGIERRTFDAALLAEARRRGARVLEGVRVREVAAGDADVAEARATGPGGEPVRIRASFLVGADGLRSVVARSVGALRRKPRLRKASLTWRVEGRGPASDRGHLLLGGDVTVGLAPVPGGRWNVTLVVGSGRYGRDLAAKGWPLLLSLLGTLAGEWEDGPRPVDGPWASGPFDWPVARPSSERVVLVGDAAGYYDPLTGQGIYRALRGAERAAREIDASIAAGRRPSGRALGGFPAGERVQKGIEAVLVRPLLREPTLSCLGASPRAGSFLARLVGDVGG